MDVPAELVEKWGHAYGRYTAMETAGVTARQAAGALEFARASWDVADAYRLMLEGSSSLPWWARAAVHTSAQVFYEQARVWDRLATEWGAQQATDRDR